MIGKTMLALLCFALVSLSAFGQNSDPKQDIGNLTGIVWKAAPGVSDVVAQEQSKMDLALTTPGMPLDERALFLSYRRLVTYIQADFQGGMPVDDALVTNYEKVLTEAPSDPDLKHLPPGLLRTFIPGLIEALTEVPQPQALGN